MPEQKAPCKENRGRLAAALDIMLKTNTKSDQPSQWAPD